MERKSIATRFRLLAMAAICALLPLLLPAAEPQKDAPPPNAKPEAGLSLHELDNHTLLQRYADALASEIDARRARLREVAEAEILFQHARDLRANLLLPRPDQRAPDLSEMESAKQRLAEVEERLAALKRKAEAADRERQRLGEYSAAINAVLSELHTFNARVLELQAYVRQIELRLADGTLSPSEVPAELGRQRLAELQQSLKDDKSRLEAAAEQARAEMELMPGMLAEIEAQLREAEAHESSAQQRLAHAQRRRELADTYGGWSRERLLAALNEQESERKWLSATLENSRAKFLAVRQTGAEIRRKLADTEDPQAAISAAASKGGDAPPSESEITMQWARERIARIDQALAQVEAMSDASGALEADASVLVEHTFPMLVIARLLEESSGEAGAVTLANLESVDEELAALVSDTKMAREEAESWKEALELDREATQQALKEARQNLEQARKLAEMNRQTEAWAEELEGMSAEQVEARFEEVYFKEQEQRQQLEASVASYQKAAAETDALRDELAALKGPFEREEEAASAALEKQILLDLYRNANLEIPENLTAAVQDPEAVAEQEETARGAEPDSEGKGQSPDEGSPVGDDGKSQEEGRLSQRITRMEAYQQLIASRLRTEEERTRLEGELSGRLAGLLEQVEDLLNELDKTHELAQQRLVAAGEFKKRVGRGEIASARNPKKIIESLKRESIARLSDKKADLQDAQTRLGQELAALEEAQAEGGDATRVFAKIAELVGLRLDELGGIRGLTAAYAVDDAQRSDIERKKIEREAERRMEAEETWVEGLMGVFYASDNLRALAEMLQGYYLELSELHRKQENLAKRKGRAEEVIAHYMAEKEALANLAEVLARGQQEAQRTRDEYKLLTQARLDPERADELLDGFEASHGYRPPLPSPLPAEGLGDFLRQSAKAEFAHEMAVRAFDRWLELVERRRSAQGLDRLVGDYQQMIADLESQHEALQRRVQLISVGPSSEIGRLRDQRVKLYRETMTVVAIKLVAILVVTFIALMVVRLSKRGWLRRAQARLEEGRSDDTSVLSIINLLGLVARLAVWSTAFLMSLSALGFNIGAILAGIGIGGFALAMAAKGVLGDIIGGITIMLTRLFKIGDRIQFKGGLYTVKAINIRYSILEDFSYNYKVTVPNSLLSETEIIDTSAHPGYTVLTNVRLSIRNPAKQIFRAIQIIEEVIQANPGARFIWVKHDHFDDFSFVIRMHYDILRFKERAKVETEINAGIVERFQQELIKLTPQPGVTLLRDAKVPAEK
jgi:small-conductance mechanosensitive channel